MQKRRKRRREGFVLTELLLAVSIVVFLIPVSLVFLSALIPSLAFHEDVQDEIALAQLRRILSLSYERQLTGDHLELRYEGKDMSLVFLNRKLILKPGTQIFLADLDDCQLVQEGDSVYVLYERKGKEKEKILTKVP
jgi:hypothetical protein